MKARSFSHSGITVSDFNRAVRFYWDVFGCPLVGVSDAPPERVRGFFGVDAPAGTLQDRLDPDPRRRRDRDLSLRTAAAGAAGRVEPDRPHAHLPQRPRHPEVARLPGLEGRDDRQPAGAVAARPLAVLRRGLRRQPDRDHRSRLHVLRAEVARAARRVDLPARDVQAGTTSSRAGNWREGSKGSKWCNFRLLPSLPQLSQVTMRKAPSRTAGARRCCWAAGISCSSGCSSRI